MVKKEESLQIAVSNYLKLQYPFVLFTSESSGIRVPIGVARRMKAQRSRHKQPDMIILHPNGYFNGLIIELKKDISAVYTKNGSLKSCEHIREQARTLEHLTSVGYKAVFGCGFDQIRQLIDDYMATATQKNLHPHV